MWYAVQVRTGQEEIVCGMIERAATPDILEECFAPKCETAFKYKGQWEMRMRHLFPGYVIVVTSRIDELVSIMKGVPAFTRCLGSNDEFIPITNAEIAIIDTLTQANDRTIEMSEGIMVGDKVKVLTGPLVGHEGWIIKVERNKRRALLSLYMFGQQVEAKVGLGIVKKYDKDGKKV